jgi:hypothetical protein
VDAGFGFDLFDDLFDLIGIFAEQAAVDFDNLLADEWAKEFVEFGFEQDCHFIGLIDGSDFSGERFESG